MSKLFCCDIHTPVHRCPTHRLQQEVRLELDVVHDVAFDVGADVDLQVRVVLDERVDDGEIPGEDVSDLVVPSSRARSAGLEVSHFDEELKGLARCQIRRGRGKSVQSAQTWVSDDARIQKGAPELLPPLAMFTPAPQTRPTFPCDVSTILLTSASDAVSRVELTPHLIDTPPPSPHGPQERNEQPKHNSIIGTNVDV